MGVAGSKPQPDSQPTLSAGYEGLDFYEILCISRDATDEDIKVGWLGGVSLSLFSF